MRSFGGVSMGLVGVRAPYCQGCRLTPYSLLKMTILDRDRPPASAHKEHLVVPG
jgi:hypothetical protein